MKKKRVLSVIGFIVFTLPAVAFSQANWLPYVSEENGGPWALCAVDSEAVSGIRCQASYWDSVGLQCQDFPSGFFASDYRPSETYSEEGATTAVSVPIGWYRADKGNSHVCNWGRVDPGVVTGIRCTGSNCDNITLECATPTAVVNGHTEPVRFTNCSWSGWYSEEDPWFAFGTSSNKYIAGIECSGRYCDNKRYYTCSMEARLDSCRDRCDGRAPQGCYCDELCEQYHDCCPDYPVECGGAAYL